MRVRTEISAIFLAFLSASYCSGCLSSSHQVCILSRKGEQQGARRVLILRKQFLLYLYRTNLCHMSFHRTLESVSVSLVQETAIKVCVCVCVCVCACTRAHVCAQSCPTFCNSMDSSPLDCYKRVCVCVFAQSCPTLYDPIDCSLRDSSVHGILQAKVLEQIAISSSRGSFELRDRTHVSCICCTCWRILYHHASSYKGN